MIHKKFSLVIFVICHLSFALSSFAQSVNRNIWLKQLTDSSFHGRGYVYNGVNIAGDYLEQEFKKVGAVGIKNKFRQSYSFAVNTFPDSMRIAVNGNNLITGVDFIPHPSSGTCFQKYDSIIILDTSFGYSAEKLNALDRKTHLVIWDIRGLKLSNKISREKYSAIFTEAKVMANFIPIVMLTDQKLTWGVGRKYLPFPIIEWKNDTLNVEEIKTIEFAIQNKMLNDFECSNVMAMVKAKKKWKKKKYLVFSAHYDHLGRMGDKTYIPGANDNASGTTMLLCLAEYYAKNPPKDFNVAFIAFSGEEAGLLGSEYFVQHPLIPLEKIEFVMNMDIMGTGDEGITVVNATKHEKEFQLLEKINAENNYLTKIKKRGPTSNSDHYHFDAKGVKAFFIYTMGGIQAYHDVFDRYETLPLTKFDDIMKMLVEFGERMNEK